MTWPALRNSRCSTRSYSNTRFLQLNVLSMTAEELSAFLDEAQEENPLIELTRNCGTVRAGVGGRTLAR